MKWVLSVMLFLALTTPLYGQEFNAGFVQGLWYDQEELFVDKPVRIYVAIRNNTGADLTGTVEFFDNEMRIERNNVSALNGRIVESWADWTPSYGPHSITATLSRTELHAVGSSTKAVTVTAALAEDVVFIDYDTDDDGIGNEKDIDDDGDGISDEDEKAAGTDPLVYDEPEETTDTDTSETSTEEELADEPDSTSEAPIGLEQFLTPSRANTLLTNVTEIAQSTKKKIDDYRMVRAEEKNPEAAEGEIVVNEDGFGAIERTQSGAKPQAKKPAGFFGDLITFIGNILSGIFTGILIVFSWFLGHPIFVQLTLLFLILFAVYKIAKRLGGRPE